MNSESLFYDCGYANIFLLCYWVDRADVGSIRCYGRLVSGTHDDNKVVVVTSAKFSGYKLIICFILSIKVMKVFVGWVSEYGGQGWVLKIYIFDIDCFGWSVHL